MQSLSQYLEQEEMSQAAFADELGVSQPTISRWLAGDAPKRSTMQRIEKITGGAVPVTAWFPKQDANEAA